MNEKEPIACALDAADLDTRLEAVRATGRAALISREQDGDRHRLRFRPEPDTRVRLEEIVDAERECCPFLSLTLAEQNGEVVLSIEAQEGGDQTAAALAAAFDAAAG
jgi:hypothetical protein